MHVFVIMFGFKVLFLACFNFKPPPYKAKKKRKMRLGPRYLAWTFLGMGRGGGVPRAPSLGPPLKTFELR